MYYMSRNTCVMQLYIIHMYYMSRTTCTCVMQVYILHMYYMCITCITHLSATLLIHMYLYTCNTPKKHIYFRCSTTGHVEGEHRKREWDMFLKLEGEWEIVFQIEKEWNIEKSIGMSDC